MDVGKILLFTTRKYPHRTAVISESERQTYQVFDERVTGWPMGFFIWVYKKGRK